jgi:AcrR family transcriptional regulator
VRREPAPRIVRQDHPPPASTKAATAKPTARCTGSPCVVCATAIGALPPPHLTSIGTSQNGLSGYFAILFLNGEAPDGEKCGNANHATRQCNTHAPSTRERRPLIPQTRRRSPKRRNAPVCAARIRRHNIQNVADELGILKGSIYHYIETKEDLLFWLLDEIHTAVEEILQQVADAQGLTPLERLALYVCEQVRYNLDNLDRISIYYHDMECLSKDRLKNLLDRRHEHERFVTDLIQQAQDNGDANPTLNARILSNCLFATIIWTYRWYRPTDPASRELIANQCADFAISGISGITGATNPANANHHTNNKPATKTPNTKTPRTPEKQR